MVLVHAPVNAASAGKHVKNQYLLRHMPSADRLSVLCSLRIKTCSHQRGTVMRCLVACANLPWAGAVSGFQKVQPGCAQRR